MRQEQRPQQRPEQTLRVSPRLITSSNILHFSAEELEYAIYQEQLDNTTLQVTEHRLCLMCGTPLYGTSGQTCSNCGRNVQHTLPDDAFAGSREPQWEQVRQGFVDIDNYGFASVESDEEYDPMARIAVNETLTETLLQQLEALVSPNDALIAEQLVGNLNGRGYLEISISEIASALDVPVERVEYVLSQLHMLEPPGIGARDLRECLLLQLHALSEQGTTHPLAHLLIAEHLDALGRNQFSEIARLLKQPEAEIREGCRYIRTMLHPFPAALFREDVYTSRSTGGATYVRPDVILRVHDTGYEVEVIEQRRYQFRIERTPTLPDAATGSDEMRQYLHTQSDAAHFFAECVHRRWRTLQRVMELVVSYQRDFLDKGVRYLRPLTRAELATRLGLDEGTVSRAIANKYALLPNGRLLPLSDFFDSSLGVKDMLREVIQAEPPKRRLSDDELARLLTAKGYPMARRTVTKYREEMGIGSSRER
jgi:RNA polymerase sigma-54 factor